MSTHNIGFYEVLTKIIFELSSNTHLISPDGIDNNYLPVIIKCASYLFFCFFYRMRT